jgi:hypothetical protein
MKKTFLKYYPFWLGLIVCLILIGRSAQYGLWSFSVLSAYGIGYYRLTKFH